MRLIDSCYFCTTPYQIITAIIMCKYKKETADIYIVAQFEKANQFAENLKSAGIFNRVRVVDETKYNKYNEFKSYFLKYCGLLFNYFNVDKYANQILFADTYYKKMYSSTRSIIPRIVFFHFVKHHIETEFIYYDDGAGTYYNRRFFEWRRFDKLVCSILFGRKAVADHDLYLYYPDMFKSIYSDYNKRRIYRIPKDDIESTLIMVKNSVFCTSTRDLIKEPVIIFDVLKKGYFLDKDIKLISKIYDLITDIFSYENVVVKPHPRDKSLKRGDYKYYENYNFPFEVLALQMCMEEKVLIAFSSTAAVLPKLLLDKEPTVILLYKIVKESKISNDFKKKRDAFFQFCKNKYINKSKMIIPENIDELRKVLKSISIKRGIGS